MRQQIKPAHVITERIQNDRVLSMLMMLNQGSVCDGEVPKTALEAAAPGKL